MKRVWSYIPPAVILILDVALSAIVFSVTTQIVQTLRGFDWTLENYLTVFIVFLAMTAVTHYVYRTYSDLHRPYISLLTSTFLAVLVTGILTIFVIFLLLPGFRSRSLIVGALVMQFVVLTTWKMLLAHFHKKWQQNRSVVVVSGSENTAMEFTKKVFPHHLTAPHVLTAAKFRKDPHEILKYEVVYGTSDLDHEDRETILEVAAGANVELYLVPDILSVLIQRSHVSILGDTPVLRVDSLRLHPLNAVLKRVSDVVMAMLLLVLTSPFFLVIPLLIKATSEGPVFYSQERVGQNGKTIRVVKFRTMVDDAEKETGPVWAKRDDPRVTGVGKWLRATRIDELPQLWNVLKGDMSLIGPRPERPLFTEEFAKANPAFRLREIVKPGITGLAQVLGRYDTDPFDKLRYDLIYITQYSLLLDFQIVFWTVYAMVFPQSWMDKQAQAEVRLLGHQGLQGEAAASLDDVDNLRRTSRSRTG